MAHRIEQYDKQQGIKQAWHGLTEVLPEITLENNWLTQWELVPVTMQKHGIDSKWTILECSDNQLEIGAPYNPNSFKPIDNQAFLQLVRDSIGGTSHKVVSVGSVRNRGRVFVSIELAGMEKFKAAGREFSAFLNFGNGHDKSSVLWANTGNVCTVCDNTYSMNLLSIENKERKTDNADDIKISLRHTKNASLRLPEIAKLIDKAIGVQAEFQLEMDNLAKQAITAKNAENLFAGFIGRNIPESEVKEGMSTRGRNTVSRLVQLFANGLGNNGRGLDDTFQAVTEYYTRESSIGANRANTQKQFVSSEFGSGANNKREFWRMVTDGDKREETIKRGESLLTVAVN